VFDIASNLNHITHETAQMIGVNRFSKAEIIYSNQFSGFLQGYNMPVNVIGFGTFHMKLFVTPMAVNIISAGQFLRT
jgi:hypothetical protein